MSRLQGITRRSSAGRLPSAVWCDRAELLVVPGHDVGSGELTPRAGGWWPHGHHPPGLLPSTYRPATRLERADWAPDPTALTACTVNR